MKKALQYLFGLVLFAAVPFVVNAQKTATLEMYHGDGCPHCARQQAWLPELQEMYPELQIEEYEVWYNEDNQAQLQQRLQELGSSSSGVPTNIVGDEVIVGFQPDAIIAAVADELGVPVAQAQSDDETDSDSGSQNLWQRLVTWLQGLFN